MDNSSGYFPNQFSPPFYCTSGAGGDGGASGEAGADATDSVLPRSGAVSGNEPASSGVRQESCRRKHQAAHGNTKQPPPSLL